jgi:release factor glutamine methyltransferase
MTSDNITENMTTSENTLGALLERGGQRLRASVAGQGPTATPNLDAELLLTYVLGTSRARLRSHPEDVSTEEQRHRYLALLERRATGEPLAYVVGTKDFWSLRLTVTPAVLVPRPETELLVERALALRHEEFGRIVDLGTGSGAIALSLAQERPGWHVTATDVSAEALAIARANAESLNLKRVQFERGSWYEPLAGRTFDLIVSNPPYVAADDPAMHDPALLHEPRGALTPGADALASLRAIIAAAPDYLERDGWLLLEHGADQAAAVARELVARGLRHVRSHHDLAGHERITEAQR